jgi:sucrose-6F-phosphate phosphohydrolase
MSAPDRIPHTNIRLFATDLDGTLLGNPEAVWRFSEAWATLNSAHRPLLAYNTSRTLVDTRSLIAARRLPEPEFILGSLGTELHDSLYNHGEEFQSQFGKVWDGKLVDEVVSATPGVRRQPGERAHPFRSGWFLVRASRDDIDDLERRLRAAKLDVTVIYSCRYFLDVVPAQAGKGKALAWLCRHLSIPLDHVVVAGDTAEDASMYLLPTVKGILVDNALPELLAATLSYRPYTARTAMADGVLEGLVHFHVITQAIPQGGQPAIPR